MVEVKFHPIFMKSLKRLHSKYKRIHQDIIPLSDELEQNPTMGTSLGNDVYKIRVKNSDKNKGKSSGYRVITYFVTEDNLLYLAEIYDKSELTNISDNRIKEIVAQIRKDLNKSPK